MSDIHDTRFGYPSRVIPLTIEGYTERSLVNLLIHAPPKRHIPAHDEVVP